MKRGLILLYVVCMLIFSPVGYCADWPNFRGPNRDGKSPETGLLKEWPTEGLKPLWVAEALGQGLAAVTVAKGCLYVPGMEGEGDNNKGILSAFDLSGKRLWKTPYGPEWKDTYPGAHSSPTYDSDRLYLLSAMGQLSCFNAKTGTIEWSQDIGKKFGGTMPRCGFAESLLTYKNTVICTPGGKDASVVALDKKTGETVWTSKGFNDMAAYCSPILIERGGKKWIVTITAMNIVGLDPDTGTLAWNQTFDPKELDQNHSVAPVYDDGRLYTTSGHRAGGQMFELSVDGKKATPKWEDKTLNTLHGGMITVGGYIYGTNAKAKWICLNVKTGEVVYEDKGLGMGSVAYAEGMFYYYGEKGMLGLVKATPKGYEMVSSFKITQGEGQHWAHPVISGGRLYIRHGDVLLAYDIKAR